jgi:hypothetical protein
VEEEIGLEEQDDEYCDVELDDDDDVYQVVCEEWLSKDR